MNDDQGGDVQPDAGMMVQTQIAIDEASFFLAQGEDPLALRSRIEEAVHGGGRFVSFTVVGDREVSILFTPHSRVTLSTATFPYDARDTGDPDTGDPHGGLFDA